MKNNLRLSIASALFIAGTTTAVALPFSSLDPRSMAMGGAGIAATSAATATSFNPAMLAAGETGDIEESFAIELPVVGMRVADPDSFLDSLDTFQDSGYIDNLSANINANNYTAISSDIDNLNNPTDGLPSLDGKPLNIELGAGMVISIPSKNFAVALSAAGTVYTSATIQYNDATALSNLSADMVLANACSTGTAAACSDIVNTTNIYNGTTPTYVTYNNGPDTIQFTADDFVDTTFDTNTDLTSKVIANGAAIGEVGLSFAREFNVMGSDIAVGITPKMASVATFHYEESVNSADTGNASDTTTDYSNFNMDVGFAKDFANGWRAGAVIKNIMAQSYDYLDSTGGATGDALEINPMLRIGVSHQSVWHTIVADLDLTENDPINGEDATQYASFGAEFNAFRIVQLRVGYRADLVNSDRSVLSVGAGVSPLGVHVDVAVAGNEQEVGAAAQFGFRF